MKDTWVKKGLVVSVILLFLGVAVVPSINQSVVTASQEDDLVEVTTQACGIRGYKDTTVKLTREQYQNLEQYLVDFRTRLNKTSTREEAVPIFKEAVVELNKYGLLPKGMSVERTQRLVFGGYQNENLMKRLSKLSENKINNINRTFNFLCLITGKTDLGTYFEGLVQIIIRNLIRILPGDFGYIVWYLFYLPLAMLNDYNPFGVGNNIGFGGIRHQIVPHPYDEPFSASGWVATLGINGLISWTGTFYGQLPLLPINVIFVEYYIGVVGFNGIKILIKAPDTSGYVYFLGLALWVKIGSEPRE